MPGGSILKDEYSQLFIDSLKSGDLAGIRSVPKADPHCHFVLGGSRDYLASRIGIRIAPLEESIQSMDEMHQWVRRHLGDRFNTPKGRRLLIESTFHRASQDGVVLLQVGEDVWANEALYRGDVSAIVSAFAQARQEIAPSVELHLQIGLSRHCSVDDILRWAEPFWDRPEFHSMDLSGAEAAQPIGAFAPVYRVARTKGLRLLAHVGEWGTANDVMEAVDLLGLHEVQHGIAVATSKSAMSYLRRNGIRLNVCPTSNVMLGRVPSMAEHPIGILHRAGVSVTVGSDDTLMFDSDVSAEYQRLYRAQVLSAEELDVVRLNGLDHRAASYLSI